MNSGRFDYTLKRSSLARDMIDALKQFFQSKLAAASTPTAVPEVAEKALRLAAGVLLFEIVRADHRIEDSERTVMRTALQSTFDLAAEETEEVMRLAEEQSRSAGSLYEFTLTTTQSCQFPLVWVGEA